jgi:hypothetical protein
MFSYYGPMHDGVAWDLFPIPKNGALPRSWLLLDAPDGDRIGECLFKGHTMEEALTLTKRMKDAWEKGMALLPFGTEHEHYTDAAALEVLLSSGHNILNFYKLRAELGAEKEDALSVVAEMEAIVRAEIENADRMTELCEKDARLGYHSEAEGFKYFPAKLKARKEKLEKLFLFREHYWGKNFATSPETYCGYGPYQITSSNSQEIILEPNPNWWGSAVTEEFDRIICRAAGKD